MIISLDTARKIGKATIKKAQEMNRLISVAVVDHRGLLVSLYRMDRAPFATAQIAHDKAWTAVAFKTPTSDIGKFGNPSSANFGFNTQNYNDHLTTIAGGLPIKDGDEVVGGVGVSGGTPEEDVVVCQEAIDALSPGSE